MTTHLKKSHVVDIEKPGGTADANIQHHSDTNVCHGGGSSSSSSTSSDDDEIPQRVSDGSSTRRKERRESCSDADEDCSVDLEIGDVEKKVHSEKKVRRDCRICQVSFDAANPESGISIELGCSCKDDLAFAHKQCAECWFKMRGNKTCEICGSTARNVVGVNDAEATEQWNEQNDDGTAAGNGIHNSSSSESRRFWQGHKFLNFLLACMVFAFVISWLFHFNVPS